MPSGISLHIGLNAVDPKQYSGWSGKLSGCEFDAEDMRAIAKKHGFATRLRLTKSAIRNKILSDLKRAAKKLRRNDIFFLSYSGHGGQVPNTGNDFEPDGFDETWCLYDGELIDDELYTALANFAAGVRIFVLSDSCHSGTVLREARFAALGVTPARPRMMPRDIALRVYMEHEQFYDKLQQRSKDPRTTALNFGVSGQPDQLGRRPERIVHRNACGRVEKWKVRRRLPRLSQGDRQVHAASANAELFHHWSGQSHIRKTKALHRITR